MTKKRFKFAHDNVGLNWKTPIMDGDKRMNIGEVLDEMNALHEQNQNLKFLNNKYAKENKSLRVIRNSLKGIKKHINLLSEDDVI